MLLKLDDGRLERGGESSHVKSGSRDGRSGSMSFLSSSGMACAIHVRRREGCKCWKLVKRGISRISNIVLDSGSTFGTMRFRHLFGAPRSNGICALSIKPLRVAAAKQQQGPIRAGV